MIQMDKEEILHKLSDYFVSRSDVQLAIVFGSYAKGTFSEKSDVDIAVDFDFVDEEQRLDKWLTMRAELELLLQKDIDLIDLKKTDGFFLSQIMAHNIRVKNNKTLYPKYLLESIYFNEDFMPIIRENQNAKIRRALNG